MSTWGTRALSHTASAQDEEANAGRVAAERLCHEWPEVEWVPDAPSEAWARGAVERLAELMQEQPALFRASREGSERGAEALSPRPFQGVLEVLQNADDLAALGLRIAVQHGRRRKLLIVHDGAPVQLTHVGAMVLPWVTTKADDPRTSGRFGIGQKTLRSLGGPIEVHCVPFHFRIEDMGPAVCRPARSIAGLYQPERRETLLVIPLFRSVDANALIEFVQNLSSRALLFLHCVRRLSLIEHKTGKRLVDHRLVENSRTEVSIHLGETVLSAERLELRVPRSRQQYVRILVERPLSKNERRHHKETGLTTTLGVALPEKPSEPISFYDRLPLPIQVGFPFSLNAQFDPDTARTTLLQRVWNERRLKDLGQLVVAAALDQFTRDTARAWRWIPLTREVPKEVGEWLSGNLQDNVVASCQNRLIDALRIEIGGELRSLSELVYEETALDGLLTPADQEFLAPGHFAIVSEQRDPEGRWREVLGELGWSELITTNKALDLFNRDNEMFGEREPRWYVEIAAAAIRAGLLGSLLSARSVLLADGTRIMPPEKDAPRSLVCRANSASLAAKLHLALPIHSAYLADDSTARQVVEKLKIAGVLRDECDSADGALQILARGPSGTQEAFPQVSVNDDQLLLLRDAFEHISEEDQRKLGPRIGRNIKLRGFTFDKRGARSNLMVSPVDAYLPTSIDRETDSFAKAASKTPGIVWLHGSYARLLKRSGGRRELGAQRFLVRLGAATAPRLARPNNERKEWKRDTRLASSIWGIDRPALQMQEIENAGFPSHLLDDRWSPDLDAVIGNIQHDRNKRGRRHRALALLAVLARAWERLYADHERAKAVAASQGHWVRPYEVIATWLARAATERWLPSATGVLNAPADLALPTMANRIAHRERRSHFLTKVDDHLLRSHAVRALRIKPGPLVSSIVDRLREMRSEPAGPKVKSEARTAYKLLALACGGSIRGMVDDMSIREFRSAFAGGRDRSGLLYVDGNWCTPKDVFVGDCIFGRTRPFVPSSPDLDALWRTLQLREPDSKECLGVLRELANSPLAREDQAIVLETCRALAASLEKMTPQLRARLRQLPLWTGESWVTSRPIYVFEDNDLAAAAAAQVSVWQSGFSSFGDLERLLEALDVTLLTYQDFVPVSLDSHGVVEGDDLRRRFAFAVEHLQTELARGDQRLHDSLALNWNELGRARVIVAEDLKIAATVANGKRVVVSAGAYALRDPITFIVRSGDHAGAADAGGRAIASLFSGDQQKVAFAWGAMWQRAGAGVTADSIVLSTATRGKEDESSERLINLKAQASKRAKRKAKAGATKGSAGAGAKADAVVVRQLKDMSRLQPDAGTIVNKGITRGGIIFPGRSKRSDGRVHGRVRTGKGGSGTKRSTVQRRTVLPPSNEREQVAYDAVQRALRLDSPQIRDLRDRRGIGADAMDELRQLYEIKMQSSAEFPIEVTLTSTEVDAADNDADFFLALVCGLEDDNGELRVRFIFDPLSQLAVRAKGDLTLTGVREVEALEYRFSKPKKASQRGG